MDTDTLNPPADLDFDKAISDHIAFEQGGGKETPPVQKAKEPTPKPPTQQKPREEARKGTEKPTVQKPEAKPDKPKSPWDKLDEVQPKEEGQTQEADTLPDNAPKDQQAWTHLKKTIKEATAQLNELKPIKEQFERLQIEHEKLKNAPPKIPQELQQEIEDLRTLKAAYDVEDTPEWNQQVTVPFKQREAFLRDFATKYGIDADQFMGSTDEPNPIDRAEKMEEILRTATREVPPSVAAMISQRVDELHQIYAHMNHMRSNAQNVWAAKQGKDAELTKAQEQEKQQKWQAAADDSFSKLGNFFDKNKMSEIFKDEQLADRVRNAKISDDETVRAFQAQFSEMADVIMTRLLKLEAEKRQHQAANEARAKAKPSMTPTEVTLPKEKGDAPDSLDEAMRLQKQWDMRRLP